MDDLVKTGAWVVKGHSLFVGGTLIECKGALLQHGAAKVSAWVTHAVFPQESWKRFIEPKPDQFYRFYTTDSCPETTNIIKDKAPFVVLPLAPSIVENILKY